MMLMKITLPFSSYHRAELERLVHTYFEAIEAHAFKSVDPANGRNSPLFSQQDFQLLVAADFFLRNTAPTGATP